MQKTTSPYSAVSHFAVSHHILHPPIFRPLEMQHLNTRSLSLPKLEYVCVVHSDLNVWVCGGKKEVSSEKYVNSWNTQTTACASYTKPNTIIAKSEKCHKVMKPLLKDHPDVIFWLLYPSAKTQNKNDSFTAVLAGLTFRYSGFQSLWEIYYVGLWDPLFRRNNSIKHGPKSSTAPTLGKGGEFIIVVSISLVLMFLMRA